MLVNIELLNVSSWEQLTISTQTAHWDLLHLRMNHEMNLKFFSRMEKFDLLGSSNG